MNTIKQIPEEFMKKITTEKVKEFLRTFGLNFIDCGNPYEGFVSNLEFLEVDSRTSARFFYRSVDSSDVEYQVIASLCNLTVANWKNAFVSRSFGEEWKEYLAKQYGEEYISSYMIAQSESIAVERRKYDKIIKEKMDELVEEIRRLSAMIVEN